MTERNPKQRIINVEWRDVEEGVRKVKLLKNYTGVYGLPRGGLCIAVMLSNKYNIPFLGAPCKGCLVVDDISDTGVTLQHYKDCGYDTYCFCWKPHTKVIPTQWSKKYPNNAWIQFPWERK